MLKDELEYYKELSNHGNWVNLASQIAYNAHYGMFRNNKKTPAVVHMASVVNKLLSWNLEFHEGVDYHIENETIIAAWLHDSIEDTDYITLKDIEYIFLNNTKIVETVDLLTYKGSSKEDKQLYIDKIAAGDNLDALFIKAADRICNTLDFINDGEIEYANKYFHYCDKIFDRINKMNFTYCSDYYSQCDEGVKRDIEFTKNLLEYIKS